jgi:Family of unknown function (DUF5681)
MAKPPPRTGTSKVGSDYQVGYGRPPLYTRFKPGKSGNPKGRPKGCLNVRTIVEKVLNRQVTIREGDGKRRVSTFEAMMLGAANEALQGKYKGCRADVIRLMQAAGVIQETPEQTGHEGVTSNDQEILADFLRRNGNPTENLSEIEPVKENSQNRIVRKEDKP